MMTSYSRPGSPLSQKSKTLLTGILAIASGLSVLGWNTAVGATPSTFSTTKIQADHLQIMNHAETLREGDRGPGVREVQLLLANCGQYNQEIDGYFDRYVTWAVERFQRDRGLAEDGIVGPVTRSWLLADCR
jgi:peptidoglycan hydrolase-like protein with peptidoglycan-binding domain